MDQGGLRKFEVPWHVGPGVAVTPHQAAEYFARCAIRFYEQNARLLKLVEEARKSRERSWPTKEEEALWAEVRRASHA